MRYWAIVIVAIFGVIGCEKKQGNNSSVEVVPAAETEAAMVEPRELAHLLKEKPELVVIDIRTPAEFAGGHIKGAVNIDFQREGFAEAIATLNAGVPTVFHCRSGGRSGQAQSLFESLPFTELYHFAAGSNGWSAAGYPINQ
jgi:rhodanese-related sulfurtransferase